MLMMGGALILASVCVYLPAVFIRHHNGVTLSVQTSVTGLLLYFSFILTGYHTSFKGDGIDKVIFLFLCGFCLMFFLLDVSNKWLPIEFTLPFCLLGLFIHIHDGNTQASITALLSMLAFLLLLRCALNKVCHAESLGKGDVWLVAGIAAWSGFIYAAAVMAASLFTLLMVCALKPLFSKSQASSFYNEQVTFPLAPAICGFFMVTTVFNVPFISNLAF